MSQEEPADTETDLEILPPLSVKLHFGGAVLLSHVRMMAALAWTGETACGVDMSTIEVVWNLKGVLEGCRNDEGHAVRANQGERGHGGSLW